MKPASQRRKLLGLEQLGSRLRQLRERAGLSQMALAGKMGFNPTHGYKYVLRLEKGLVPNPTLRTVLGFIESCSADWNDLADVLPRTGPPSGGKTTAPPGPRVKKKRRRSAQQHEAVETPTPGTVRADSRPLRVRMRSELMAERTKRADRYWQEVTQAEQEVARLLQSRRVLSSAHREYVAFVRPCCSVIQSFSSSRPQVVERELARLVQRTVVHGLDEGILEEVKDVCQRRLRLGEDSSAE